MSKINKNLYLLVSVPILIGLFFLMFIPFASAANCDTSQKQQSYLSSYLNPLLSFMESTINGFGYKIALATVPDPDFCGSDNVICSSEGLPVATISWVGAPSISSSDPKFAPMYDLHHYILAIPGVGSHNTTQNAYTVSSGLINEKNYDWYVEAYYGLNGGLLFSSASLGFTSQPRGSFATPDCSGLPKGEDEDTTPIVELIAPSTVLANNPINLNWDSINTNSCVASGDWSGNKAVDGEEDILKPKGIYTFTITCVGPGGTAEDTKEVRVIQGPICTFFADPISIILPQHSTLFWACQYADKCSIDHGIGEVDNVSGDTEVSPIETTTYNLFCEGNDGSISLPATVDVGFTFWLREILPR